MTTTDWIQAMSTLVLVVVTGIYAWRTHVISKATKEQADAMIEQAKVTKEQTKILKETVGLSVRPSISIELLQTQGGHAYPFEPPSGLYVELSNGGKGPARNLVLTCEAQDKKVEYSKIELPSLNVGDKRKFSIQRVTPVSGDELRVAYILVKVLYNDELRESWSITLQIDRNGEWKSGEIIIERR